MNSAGDIERSIEQLHFTTTAETDRRILDDTCAALERAAHNRPTGVRQAILKSRAVRLTAAAAVIAVALGLAFYLRTPPPQDITIARIIQSLGGVDNVCVERYQPQDTEPFQRVWSSRSLKVEFFETRLDDGMQLTLLDVPYGVRKTKYASSDRIRTQQLSGDMIFEIEALISGTFGLIPSVDIEQAAGSARWSYIDRDSVTAVVPQSRVYDLDWTEGLAASDGRRCLKWRVFVDSRSNLPRRIERYEKPDAEQNFRLETAEIISYPDDSEVEDLIYATFGPDRSERPGSELVGTPAPAEK